MKVTIVGGTGYIGLVTGLGFAVNGHDVICADIDEIKIEALKAGELPIYERGLADLYNCAKKDKKVIFTTAVEFSIRQSEIIMITVGTPSSSSGETDMVQIDSVLKSIAQYMDSYKLIVIKSTVPVGTAEYAKRMLQRYLKRTHVRFDIVSNPEFLREGKAVDDFMFPERIVIGTESKRAREMMRTLYQNFNAPLIFTDIVSSEMIKYACNAYLATRLSYINEIAEISENIGADIHSVITGMSYDRRIGNHYLRPGPGFGGPCLNKDIQSLIHFGQSAHADVSLLKSVLNRNTRQIENLSNYVISQINALNMPLSDIKVAVLGLSFKSETDDIRNSPAIQLIDMLIKKGVAIDAYDPLVKSLYQRHRQSVSIKETVLSAVEGAHIVIFMTDWQIFKKIDLKRLRECIAHPIIVDARNIIDVNIAESLGFIYKGVGISAKKQPKVLPKAL